MSPAPGRYLPCNHPWRECRKRLSNLNHLPRHRERGQYSARDLFRSALKSCSRSTAIIRCRETEKIAVFSFLSPHCVTQPAPCFVRPAGFEVTPSRSSRKRQIRSTHTIEIAIISLLLRD